MNRQAEEADRRALKRAALVAAAVFNARRTKRSDPVVKPEDFIQEKPKRLTPKQAVAYMDRWAASINRRH